MILSYLFLRFRISSSALSRVTCTPSGIQDGRGWPYARMNQGLHPVFTHQTSHHSALNVLSLSTLPAASRHSLQCDARGRAARWTYPGPGLNLIHARQVEHLIG